MQAAEGYPLGQLAKAFVTAVTHADAGTRRRAEDRMRHWRDVLDGMARGDLAIGSRAPLADHPAWVTPKVIRGGFATGEPAAGGPMRPWETEAAARAGLPADRRMLFAHHLTDAGLAELYAMLDSGGYHVEVPEEAALLTVAWLLRAGDQEAALDLLDALEPYAGRLRFTPAPAEPVVTDPSVVWRDTAADAGGALARRRPDERIETMREALTVWNPFADELLTLWLEDGALEGRFTAHWRARGAELLARYDTLAAAHTRCGKHRDPKENPAILRLALAEAVAGRPFRTGRVRHAVTSMVRRRGAPGSQRHTALRARQAGDAARPTHHALAQIMVRRLATLPQHTGVFSVETLLRPVTREESTAYAGTPMPEPIRKVVERARADTLEALTERGVVGSAEVLAELVPRIAAATTAAAYSDEALRTLMADCYRAFRDRRSVLLFDLAHQVQVEELPWVRAVAAHRRGDEADRRDAHAVLVRLAELTMTAFPATVTPNPLVRELTALAVRAGADVPLVEELAADIFMGTFSAKFLRAAQVAGELLGGSLYARYYGIDYPAVLAISDVAKRKRHAAHTSDAFAALCHARAGSPSGSVAANGMVIEQAQILTTHNLAALVRLGARGDWPDLARRAFEQVNALVARVGAQPRALSTVKDAAYAWRQCLFFLSVGSVDLTAFLAWADDLAAGDGRVTTLLAGLRRVAGGGVLDRDASPELRPFTGWVTGRHWMRPAGVHTVG